MTAAAPLIGMRTQACPVVLLADGDADTRQLYAAHLRASAFVIDEADNGAEALAKAITVQPNIVVTETRLPSIDGYELCGLLRKDPATRATPIVVVTGEAFEPDIRRAKNAGADVVLVKPCLPHVLFAEVRRLLEWSSALRARAEATRVKSTEQVVRSERLIEKSNELQRRTMLSRSYTRHDTIDPPHPPPALFCPMCDQPLRYVRSHIGGVSIRHPEQWDYLECGEGCGDFQYRQRTRKLRKV